MLAPVLDARASVWICVFMGNLECALFLLRLVLVGFFLLFSFFAALIPVSHRWHISLKWESTSLAKPFPGFSDNIQSFFLLCFSYLELVQLEISCYESFMFSSCSQHFGQGATLSLAVELISESFMWLLAINKALVLSLNFSARLLAFAIKSSIISPLVVLQKTSTDLPDFLFICH